MILNKLAQVLYTSGQNVVGIMRSKLNTGVRGGNRLPQSNTYRTAESLSAKVPDVSGGKLTWEFVGKDSAVRLNTGGGLKGPGDVPYSGKSGKSGQTSKYIDALTKWAITKYGIDSVSAKRMAFSIAHTAVKRGRVVDSTGWLDDAKAQLDKQIMGDIATLLNQEINKFIMTELKY